MSTDSCVKFSRNAWHSRLLLYVLGKGYFFWFNWNEEKKSYEDEPKHINLCPYVRLVFASLVLFPFLVVWRHLPEYIQDNPDIARALIIWAIICLVIHVAVVSYDDELWYVGLVIYFGGISVVLLSVGLILGVGELIDRIKARRRKAPIKEHKTVGLLKSYAHAKHEKICPCVEFVEEGEVEK